MQTLCSITTLQHTLHTRSGIANLRAVAHYQVAACSKAGHTGGRRAHALVWSSLHARGSHLALTHEALLAWTVAVSLPSHQQQSSCAHTQNFLWISDSHLALAHKASFTQALAVCVSSSICPSGMFAHRLLKCSWGYLCAPCLPLTIPSFPSTKPPSQKCWGSLS